MAGVVTAEVPGMTQEQGRGMLDQMGQQLRQAKGFVAHASGPIQGGYRIVEVWQSREDWQRWFDADIQPQLKSASLAEPTQQFFEAPTL